ncbi:biotin--[acetyl-CoA-carboxylase] ligase [Marinicella rhabdoformis]|uniref:biotin--[acetyl-CoA-carboxylase] ligase n=1 Tax=Marinicella rhabdoformis TaxID=2580566 RepID=UPI0012AEC9A1|nr:biotin--[acetyl-CoA-carboxylase] ligase [Marinicella rhabdoformis]
MNKSPIKRQQQLFQQWSQSRSSLNPAEQAELMSLGLDVFRPIEPINKEQIQSEIDFSNIETVFSTVSTQKNVQANSTLVAEHQSAGVGQRGKSWSTPLGLSACLSQRFELDIGLQKMTGYPLIIALACLQSIKTFDPQAAVSIKWPNDLYCYGVKFAGILTEVQPKSEKQTEVTLGIGINWQLGPQHFAQIDQPVCNIPLNTRDVTRNEYIITLLKQIQNNNQQFINHGFASFVESWQANDALNGQQLTLNTASGAYQGDYAGISDQGEIQLNINGELKRFASGEAQILKS